MYAERAITKPSTIIDRIVNEAPGDQSADASQALWTALRWVGDCSFSGFVVDRSDLKRKFVVDILVDGRPVAVVRADQPSHELIAERFGDGCYGFFVSLRADLLRESASVEARLANLGVLVGAPILLDESFADTGQIGVGEAQWLDGLHFSGWVADAAEAPPLTIEVDGLFVDQARCGSWRHIGSAENARPVRGFDFHLPTRFADGLVHRLTVLTDRGQALDACPLSFLVHPRIERQEEVAGPSDLAAKGGDRSAAISAPFSDYGRWREKFLNSDVDAVATQIAVAMYGPGEAHDTVESLREQRHGDWAAVALPAGPGPASFAPEDLCEFLDQEGAACEFVVCAPAGSLFAADALGRIAAGFLEVPEAIIVYGDFELQGSDGALWPIALPAFDYERMLEQGYCARLFAIRRETLQKCLTTGAANCYRLFNAALDDDQTQRRNIVHLPGSLAILPRMDTGVATGALREASELHLKQRRIEAVCAAAKGAAFPTVRVLRAAPSRRVTVVVPARNRIDRLRNTLASIAPAAAKRAAEILVVADAGADAEQFDFLGETERRRTRVLQAASPFNRADLMNEAARAATGEVLCLLDGDVVALDEAWLDEMICRLSEPDVGAVGALIVSSSGVVEHGGVVLGPAFAVAPAFADRLASDPGYGDLLRAAHECSAASSACLLINRDDYLASGGMDPVQFPIRFPDIDLCLKLRATGKRIIFSPHAKFKRQSAQGGAALHDALYERELRILRAKWGTSLAADPYYNPTLSLGPIPYSALAWPPRSLAPRSNVPPIANDVLPGF